MQYCNVLYNHLVYRFQCNTLSTTQCIDTNYAIIQSILQLFTILKVLRSNVHKTAMSFFSTQCIDPNCITHSNFHFFFYHRSTYNATYINKKAVNNRSRCKIQQTYRQFNHNNKLSENM